MEILLSLLLYLSVIVSPASYYDYEIEAFETAHQQEIDAIEQDPVLVQQIVDQFREDVVNILIIDFETEY